MLLSHKARDRYSILARRMGRVYALRTGATNDVIQERVWAALGELRSTLPRHFIPGSASCCCNGLLLTNWHSRYSSCKASNWLSIHLPGWVNVSACSHHRLRAGVFAVERSQGDAVADSSHTVRNVHAARAADAHAANMPPDLRHCGCRLVGIAPR
jgi:hypothetical protein